MSQQEQIKIFQEQKVRSVWDEEKENWYFSIVDVCSVLTDQPDYDKARKYWNKLKQRLSKEDFEPVTNCHQLKLTAKDGNNLRLFHVNFSFSFTIPVFRFSTYKILSEDCFISILRQFQYCLGFWDKVSMRACPLIVKPVLGLFFSLIPLIK